MKRLFFIFLAAFSLISCTPSWVRELEAKNPLLNDTNFISVYFRFDTVMNDFEVSGIIYPLYDKQYGWSACENGVRMFFHSLKTGKEYVWTDWDEACQSFKWYFMSYNIRKMVYDKNFAGFKNGESFVFEYFTTPAKYSNNTLLPYAEYQFYDADFDGEEELILGYYAGEPRDCVCFEIYDITDTALVRKVPIGDHFYFCLDANSVFDAKNRLIINYLYDGTWEWGTYTYKADENGDFHWLYYASTACDIYGNIATSDTTYFKL